MSSPAAAARTSARHGTAHPAPPHARALAAWSGAALVAALLDIDPLLRGLVLLIALNLAAQLRLPGVSLRPLAIAMVSTAVLAVVFDLLLSHTGDHVVLTLPEQLPGLGGRVTLEAGAFGMATALGIAAALAAVAVPALALQPQELVGMLPRALERVAVAAAAALTLVPALGRSWTAVREAQRCRGWRPRRGRGWTDLVMPVTLTAIEDSVQLAETLEARGYGSTRRTHFAVAALNRRDLAVLLSCAAAVALLITAHTTAAVSDWYPFPTLSVPPASWPALAAAALLATPLLAWPSSNSVA